MRPPFSSTKLRTIPRPSPSPSSFTLCETRVSRSKASSESLGPLSSTSTITASADGAAGLGDGFSANGLGRVSLRNLTSTPPSGSPWTASAAFFMTLSSRSSISSGSPRMMRRRLDASSALSEKGGRITTKGRSSALSDLRAFWASRTISTGTGSACWRRA